MHTVLLIGAGKSATVLIDYLLSEASSGRWKVIIADANREQVLSKTGHSPLAEAVALDVTDDARRGELVQRADLVISMMPPSLHFLVAQDCLLYGRHLLTASYLDDRIRSMDADLKKKNLLFLCEMGLDPGIDHMSAMQLLDHIRESGGTIHSFRSHCGGLVAPESDNNPWHYKISWNPRNVVLAGKAGAEFLEDGIPVHRTYQEIFTRCRQVQVTGLPPLAWYPNRDSLGYMPVYKLENARTFIRTTLRYPAFCEAWQALVEAGLTDDTLPLQNPGASFREWSAPLLPLVTDAIRPALEFLGLFDEQPLPAPVRNAADVLQYLLETKLAMQPADKDMIVMLHEIGYTLSGKEYALNSSLVVKGDDYLRTAMAKTVGLPLGIAAALLLEGKIPLQGVHIPVVKEIYQPVLEALKTHGIKFTEEEENG